MHACKFCNKQFSTGPKLGGHVVTCLLNPDSTTTLKKIKEAKLKQTKANRTVLVLSCLKCKTKFEQVVSKRNFETSRYTKHCTRSCANSRKYTEAIRKKVKNTFSKKVTYKP